MKFLRETLKIAFFATIVVGCAQKPVEAPTPPADPVVVAPAPTPTPPPSQPEPQRTALYWENTTEPHPERKPWSDHLTRLVRENLKVYDSARDITTFCPRWKSLSSSEKIKAAGEFWVAVAYYESGFNPRSQSVDVGTAENRDTWSVGLFQMSVVDQKNYALSLGYDFDDLNTAIPNITLAHAVMMRQIKNRALIVVPSKPYWAVLYRGKYDKVDAITNRVKKHAPRCLAGD